MAHTRAHTELDRQLAERYGPNAVAPQPAAGNQSSFNFDELERLFAMFQQQQAPQQQPGFLEPNFAQNFDPGSYNITAQRNEANAENPLQLNNPNGFIGRFLRNFRRDRPRLFNRGQNDQGQTLGALGRPIGPAPTAQAPIREALGGELRRVQPGVPLPTGPGRVFPGSQYDVHQNYGQQRRLYRSAKDVGAGPLSYLGRLQNRGQQGRGLGL